MLAIIGTLLGISFLLSEAGRTLVLLIVTGALYLISTGLPFVLLILLLR